MKLPVSAPSADDGGLLHSGDGRRDEGKRNVSPSDPVESLNAFTRKIGAFVNKPSAQVNHTRLTHTHTHMQACLFLPDGVSVKLFERGFSLCLPLLNLCVCRSQQPVWTCRSLRLLLEAWTQRRMIPW